MYRVRVLCDDFHHLVRRLAIPRLLHCLKLLAVDLCPRLLSRLDGSFHLDLNQIDWPVSKQDVIEHSLILLYFDTEITVGIDSCLGNNASF